MLYRVCSCAPLMIKGYKTFLPPNTFPKQNRKRCFTTNFRCKRYQILFTVSWRCRCLIFCYCNEIHMFCTWHIFVIQPTTIQLTQWNANPKTHSFETKFEGETRIRFNSFYNIFFFTKPINDYENDNYFVSANVKCHNHSSFHTGKHSSFLGEFSPNSMMNYETSTAFQNMVIK